MWEVLGSSPSRDKDLPKKKQKNKKGSDKKNRLVSIDILYLLSVFELSGINGPYAIAIPKVLSFVISLLGSLIVVIVDSMFNPFEDCRET